MIRARRETTYKQYETYLRPWFVFTNSNNINPFSPIVPQAINFMAHIRDSRKLGYNAVNTMRSALSSIIVYPDGIPFGQRPEVKLFMRGLFNTKPPVPRYADIWDPQTVLTFLKRWSPAHTLTMKQLTLKVLLLMLLVSGQRLQTLYYLDLKCMKQSSSSFSFIVSDLLKQSRPGYKNPKMTLTAYAPDRRICVYTYLALYITKTQPIRGNITSLFITISKPHRRASKDTLARWVKDVLREAGIDITVYGPHSCRAASSSAAKRGGANIQTILDTAGWSDNSTFARYYQRTVDNRDYARAVLDK